MNVLYLSKRFLHNKLIVGILVAIGVVLAAVPVLAHEDEDPPPPPGSIAELQSEDGGYNPYGCFGQTDNPHKSSNTWAANVHAKSECAVNVPEIHVTTQLYKESCFLTFCEWEVHGPVAPKWDVDRKLVKVNSAGPPPCENGKYKGTSSHSVIGANGIQYIAFTENIQIINNC